MPFELGNAPPPAGDQPRAIRELTAGLLRGDKYQTLLGVTGSGKTMTMAHAIANFGKPTLVLSHNKTLAAQLYRELKAVVPSSAVEFFISYYDYYQPEAYVPSTDTYIAKDSSINDDIERLRLRATSSLMERDDVVIVASVSAIYGLGDPELYRELLVTAQKGQQRARDELLADLVAVQYQRNDIGFERGTFRVRGDTVEVFPAYDEQAVRIEFWGDEIERIAKIDPLTGNVIKQMEKSAIYPATHFVTQRATIERAVTRIRAELAERLAELRGQNKLLEAQRLESRTHFDIDMLMEVGRCAGIENYSRHFGGRQAGERPACLLDYFPDDYVCIIDESHQTLPQLGAMFEGDRSRKQTLVDYGFRLPSALDKRPLRFDEFFQLVPRMVFVSATPGQDELRLSGGVIVEQIIRPTGPVDPGGGIGGPRPSRRRPGGRSAQRDPAPRKEERARARDHADQAHGRGSYGLSAAARRARALPAFGNRRDRARRHQPGLGARRVRRAGRDQSAARRIGPARGVARGRARRRSGRLPALGPLAHSDGGPRGAQSQRQGDSLRRSRHGLDGARIAGDEPPARNADRLQRRAQHHAALDRQIGRRYPLRHARRRCAGGQGRHGRAAPPRRRRRARNAHHHARAADAGGRRRARLRAGGGPPRSAPRAQSRCPSRSPRPSSTGSVRTSAVA